MVLQQPLRKRTIVFPAWGEDRLFYGQAHTEMDVFEMVPLWISDFLSDYVWKYGVSDLSGVRRGKFPEGSDQAVLDDQSAMGMDLYSGYGTGLGSTVQLWILQSDADISADRFDRYVFL